MVSNKLRTYNVYIDDTGTPKIIINGDRFGVISCRYFYTTKTEQPLSGSSVLEVTGYLHEYGAYKEYKLRIDFNEKRIEEIK